MEAEQIFKELMKSEELQTHFGISKEELADASYVVIGIVFLALQLSGSSLLPAFVPPVPAG